MVKLNTTLHNQYVGKLTFLAVVGRPATVAVVMEVGLLAKGLVLIDSRTHIPTFFGLLIPINVVVKFSVHDKRPVHRVQIAELRVFLNPDGTSGDVPQVVQADVLQAGHLEDHQGIVVEEVASSDDGEVGEERAKAVQAGHPEQEQVVGDHCELGKAEGSEDILVGIIVLVTNEEDLQVALNHRAVLQPTKFSDVIANVDAGTTD